jgi:hypothetical protein
VSAIEITEIRGLLSSQPRPPAAPGLPCVRVRAWCPDRGSEVPVAVYDDPAPSAEDAQHIAATALAIRAAR